jgi:hypothetical protein
VKITCVACLYVNYVIQHNPFGLFLTYWLSELNDSCGVMGDFGRMGDPKGTTFFLV